MSENRKKGILILGIGVLIMLISFLLPVGNGTVKENNRIPRQEYGGGDTIYFERDGTLENVNINAKGFTNKKTYVILRVQAWLSLNK